MNEALQRNLTDEEYCRYVLGDSDSERIRSLGERVADLEQELEQQEREHESVHEQLYFAEELLESIELACEQETRARELKKQIAYLISDSQFEG